MRNCAIMHPLHLELDTAIYLFLVNDLWLMFCNYT